MELTACPPLHQYIPTPTLLSGIKSGKLVKGYYNANPYNYLEVRPALDRLGCSLALRCPLIESSTCYRVFRAPSTRARTPRAF